MSECECGRVTGVPCESNAKELVQVYVMPKSMRASHEAANNVGWYPHNGADKLQVDPECGRHLRDVEGTWVSTDPGFHGWEVNDADA